jgi:hypothetical protein
VLASVGTEASDDWASALPDQLAIEFHVSSSLMYIGSPSHMKADDFTK